MQRHITLGLLIGIVLSLVVGITFIVSDVPVLLTVLGVYASIAISVIVVMIVTWPLKTSPDFVR